MKLKKINELGIKNLLITIFLVVLVVIVGTYAWLTYRSKDTAMVLTIGDINNIQITLKPYQLDLSLSPVLELDEEGDYVTVTVVNNNASAKAFSLYYDIEEIASGLQSSDFMYTIIRTNDNDTIIGNFVGANTTNNFTILNGNIPASTTYTYKVYLWLHGDDTNAPGLAFKGELRASID